MRQAFVDLDDIGGFADSLFEIYVFVPKRVAVEIQAHELGGALEKSGTVSMRMRLVGQKGVGRGSDN